MEIEKNGHQVFYILIKIKLNIIKFQLFPKMANNFINNIKLFEVMNRRTIFGALMVATTLFVVIFMTTPMAKAAPAGMSLLLQPQNNKMIKCQSSL